MRIFIYVFGLLFLIILATWSYQVNYETRKNISTSEELQSKINEKKEYLNILKAEWAYLNRPKRLELLVEKYFDSLRLIPLRSDHYADVSMINFLSSEGLKPNVGSQNLSQPKQKIVGLDD